VDAIAKDLIISEEKASARYFIEPDILARKVNASDPGSQVVLNGFPATRVKKCTCICFVKPRVYCNNISLRISHRSPFVNRSNPKG
jgi:hypothetical protein